MFYMNYTLANSDSPDSYFAKYRFLSLEEIQAKLKAIPNVNKEYTKIKNFYIRVHKSFDISVCTVTLCIVNTDNLDFPLCSVTLSTVTHNCSAILLSNLCCETFIKTGMAWDFLNYIEGWCKYAGYTFLYGTIAGNQLSLLQKLKKQGWNEMGPTYINQRTLNTNMWLYKLIEHEAQPDEDDEEEYEEDNNQDEDF